MHKQQKQKKKEKAYLDRAWLSVKGRDVGIKEHCKPLQDLLQLGNAQL